MILGKKGKDLGLEKYREAVLGKNGMTEVFGWYLDSIWILTTLPHKFYFDFCLFKFVFFQFSQKFIF